MTSAYAVPTQEQIREGWDRIAEQFDRYVTSATLSLGEKALKVADLRRGDRFLDVAAGSGALSIPAARLGADVVAADIAPTMIERLTVRAGEEGLSNLDARIMDGYDLDLDDDSFDIAGSQNGVSLFPDLDRGLGEMVRVTKPGGRVLIVAFGPIEEAEFLTFFLGALQASVPGFMGLPSGPPPLPFQVADPEKLRRKLADAGLKDIEVNVVDWPIEFVSGDHFWNFVTSGNPIAGELTSELAEEQKNTVRQVLDGMLRERSDGGPAAVNNRVNIGIGRKR